MSKFVGAVTCLLDIDSNVVCRMFLIFDIDSCVLELSDDQCQSVIISAKDDSIIYVDNIYDVIMVEDTFVDLRLLEANFLQLVYMY